MVIEGGLPLCLRRMYWLSRTYGSLSLRFFADCSGAASSGALRLVEDGRGASRRRGAWAGRATWAVAMVKCVEIVEWYAHLVAWWPIDRLVEVSYSGLMVVSCVW